MAKILTYGKSPKQFGIDITSFGGITLDNFTVNNDAQTVQVQGGYGEQIGLIVNDITSTFSYSGAILNDEENPYSAKVGGTDAGALANYAVYSEGLIECVGEWQGAPVSAVITSNSNSASAGNFAQFSVNGVYLPFS